MTGGALLLSDTTFAGLTVLANVSSQPPMLAKFAKTDGLRLPGGTIIGLWVKCTLDRKGALADANSVRSGQIGMTVWLLLGCLLKCQFDRRHEFTRPRPA